MISFNLAHVFHYSELSRLIYTEYDEILCSLETLLCRVLRQVLIQIFVCVYIIMVYNYSLFNFLSNKIFICGIDLHAVYWLDLSLTVLAIVDFLIKGELQHIST